MKRAVSFALALTLICGMTACGSQKTEEPKQETVNELQVTETSQSGEEVQTAEASESAEKTQTAETSQSTEKAGTPDESQTGEEEAHFMAYLKGEETDADGETFWALEEPDIEYALYDLNADGVKELFVRAYGYWINGIMEYRDGAVRYERCEIISSSGVTFINDKDQFVSGDTGHEGRNMYVVSELDKKGDSKMVLALVNYYDDWAASGEPEFYKMENPPEDYLEQIDRFDRITEEEYNSLIEGFSVENTAIEWKKLN